VDESLGDDAGDGSVVEESAPVLEGKVGTGGYCSVPPTVERRSRGCSAIHATGELQIETRLFGGSGVR
jgi:hypothetical protein